jgi:hypothetical protein
LRVELILNAFITIGLRDFHGGGRSAAAVSEGDGGDH